MLIKEISRKASSGFSLIELLLVLFLAPIVFFAVFSNFVSGVSLWQRLQTPVPAEDTAIFLAKARVDFNNMRRYTAIPFEGGEEEVVFAGGIEAKPALGGIRGIGSVRYYYDASARAIMRETSDISRLYQDRPGERTLMLKGVSSFSIAYMVVEPPSSEYEWREEYRPDKPETLPSAVRLSWAQNDSQDMQTFIVPAGGALS